MNKDNELPHQDPSSGCQDDPSSKPKEAKKIKESAALKELLLQIEQQTQAETKLQRLLEFMREALGHTPSPKFKDFWEARYHCLPLFKEELDPLKREKFWKEYLELSGEAKRIKEIVDEQSAFAAEQIDLAISAIETELNSLKETLTQIPRFVPPAESQALKKHKESYSQLQTELSFLNTLASRINSLRREVMKTDMRVRFKSKLFQRLSLLGDLIFPRRKELIKTVSDLFSEDVAIFIRDQFEESSQPLPWFTLRNEIKLLQHVARQLTLSTAAFTKTRLGLSKCWDQLREREKEHRKQLSERKELSKQNSDEVAKKILAFKEKCDALTVTQEEAKKLEREILDYMRSVELDRLDVKALRKSLIAAQNALYEKERKEETLREEKVRESKRKQIEKFEDLLKRCTLLVEEVLNLQTDELAERKKELLEEIKQLDLSKVERHKLDLIFKELKMRVDEKREQMLQNLGGDSLASFEALKNLLAQQNKERQEIKVQLESCRRELGQSGFDFEKAMHCRELIEEEKQRLEKINKAIEEIEEKIAEFEE